MLVKALHVLFLTNIVTDGGHSDMSVSSCTPLTLQSSLLLCWNRFHKMSSLSSPLVLLSFSYRHVGRSPLKPVVHLWILFEKEIRFLSLWLSAWIMQKSSLVIVTFFGGEEEEQKMLEELLYITSFWKTFLMHKCTWIHWKLLLYCFYRPHCSKINNFFFYFSIKKSLKNRQNRRRF